MRELATGSITSSRVMELMSNQASEVLPATSTERIRPRYIASEAVVNSAVQSVQSTVQVSLFVVLPHEAKTPVARIGTNSKKAELVVTLLVLTKHLSRYFVLDFTGINFH